MEASFADLRHGGDGNLTKAHDLLKKVSSHITSIELLSDRLVQLFSIVKQSMIIIIIT